MFCCCGVSVHQLGLLQTSESIALQINTRSFLARLPNLLFILLYSCLELGILIKISAKHPNMKSMALECCNKPGIGCQIERVEQFMSSVLQTNMTIITIIVQWKEYRFVLTKSQVEWEKCHTRDLILYGDIWIFLMKIGNGAVHLSGYFGILIKSCSWNYMTLLWGGVRGEHISRVSHILVGHWSKFDWHRHCQGQKYIWPEITGIKSTILCSLPVSNWTNI